MSARVLLGLFSLVLNAHFFLPGRSVRILENSEFRRPYFRYRRTRFLPLHVHDSRNTDSRRYVSPTQNEDRQIASLGTENRAPQAGLKHCSFIELESVRKEIGRDVCATQTGAPFLQHDNATVFMSDTIADIPPKVVSAGHQLQNVTRPSRLPWVETDLRQNPEQFE
jgi:hypothetical protein